MTFYTHIGGLRGIAILLVILFHLNSVAFPCCFYGVDVFFVISGYLLFVGLKRRDGGVRAEAEFCYKRLQRIMPPVAVVILCSIICGIFLLDNRVLSDACRLGRYTLFCIPNLHLNKISADYFAAATMESPFMHMWYVGVILQVYLIFVAGKIISRYLPARSRVLFVVLVSIGSLLLCYSMPLRDMLAAVGLPTWQQSSAPTYFETWPRVWEVLAGGCVLILPELRSKLAATLLSGVGILAILLPSFLLRAQTTAIFPLIVAGTVLVIRYTPGSALMSILSSKVFLAIGAVSFSLYLVHMPIFECYQSWAGSEPTWVDYILMLFLTALLGTLCWYVLERKKVSWKIWLPLYLLTMAVCVSGRKTNGFEVLTDSISSVNLLPEYKGWKVADRAYYAKGFDAAKMSQHNGVFHLMEVNADKHDNTKPALMLGTGSALPNFVLVGDSHAQASYAGMDTFCKENNRSGLYLTTIISPFWDKTVPLIPGRHNYYCNREKMQAFLAWLSANENIEHIVVAMYWELRLKNNTHDWDMKPADISVEAQTENLREFLRKTQALGKKTSFILPYPRYSTNPLKHMRWIVRRGKNVEEYKSPITVSDAMYESQNVRALQMLRSLEKEGLCTLINPIANPPRDRVFCAYDRGELLYKDFDHLSVPGSIQYFRRMTPQLLEIISTPKHTYSEQ